MAQITKADLDALKDEEAALSVSPESLADKLFKEALPEAVLVLCKLAREAQSEGVQLKAATYVTERILGRLQDINAVGIEDPLIEMVKAAIAKDNDEA